MKLAKKSVFAAAIGALFMEMPAFCCFSFPTPIFVSSETTQIIDTTYKNLMRFSNAADVLHEDLRVCGIDPDKIRVINLESILKVILPGEPAHINYYLRMSHDEQLFLQALDRLLHSDKTLFAFSSTSLYQGNCIEEWKDKISEVGIAKSYMNYVQATFLTAYQRSQKYRERLVTFLAALEWCRKSDPEFIVSFSKGDKIQEIPNEHGLSLVLELSNGEHYKSTGYSCTLPIPCEDAYPNELTPIKDAMDDVFACMHELGHAIHDLLDIHISTQIPFVWVAKNQFMKNTFFSFLSKVEKNVDACVERMKNPKTRKTLLESLLMNRPENSDFQTISVDSKQYYEQCLQIVEENCQTALQSLEGTEIEKIKNALSSEEFAVDDTFLKKFGELITQYMSFITWTRPEELWQIMGTLILNNCTFVMDSDFDVKVSLAQRIRWLHMAALKVSQTEKSAQSMGGMLSAPEEKFIRVLFALHGVKYEDYLEQITETPTSTEE